MLHVVFIPNCKKINCDNDTITLTNWVNGKSGQSHLGKFIIACPIEDLKEVPETFKDLQMVTKGKYLVGAITFATGHGLPGKMQLGTTWIEAKDFEQNLSSVRVNWGPNGTIYLNPCSCAKGNKGLLLCKEIAKYFAGEVLPVSVIGAIRKMIGTPPPIWQTADTAVRKLLYSRITGIK